MKAIFLFSFSLFVSIYSLASFRVPSIVVPQPDVTGSFYGSGHVVSYPVRELSQLLPAELELAPQSITAEGAHPLLIWQGTQSQVRHVIGKMPVTIPMLEPVSYDELIVAIPYVQLKKEFRKGLKYYGPFYYMHNLFLNNKLAVSLGYLYGYNKEGADIDSSYYKMEAFTASKLKPAISVHVGQAKSKYLESNKVAAFQPMQKMISMPLIGKLKMGSYICSHFSWSGSAPIRVAPAASRLQINALSGLGLGSFTSESLGMDQETAGSFRIISHWRLQGPFSCGSL